MHLVGYSYGGALAVATRAALVGCNIMVSSFVLIDPIPFGSQPSDTRPLESDNSLVASAHLFELLAKRLHYNECDGALLAAIQAGDVVTGPALTLALRELLPSESAYEEISRIARHLECLDITVNWLALPKLDDIPVVFFKMEGGPDRFQRRRRPNWNHPDDIYGWTALQPKTQGTNPIVLEGGHFEAFSGKENLRAISEGIATLIIPPNKEA